MPMILEQMPGRQPRLCGVRDIELVFDPILAPGDKYWIKTSNGTLLECEFNGSFRISAPGKALIVTIAGFCRVEGDIDWVKVSRRPDLSDAYHIIPPKDARIGSPERQLQRAFEESGEPAIGELMGEAWLREKRGVEFFVPDLAAEDVPAERTSLRHMLGMPAASLGRWSRGAYGLLARSAQR
jgi:hypothetical protein